MTVLRPLCPLSSRGTGSLRSTTRVAEKVHEGEGDEEDVGLRVRERTQPVVILLPRGIPKAEVDRLAVDHHVRRVVVEHGGDVVLGESVGGVCAAAVSGERVG